MSRDNSTVHYSDGEKPHRELIDAREEYHRTLEKIRAGYWSDPDLLLFDLSCYAHEVHAATGSLEELLGALRYETRNPNTSMKRLFKLGNRVDKQAIVDLGLPQLPEFKSEGMD